jgi:hypothetical protein
VQSVGALHLFAHASAYSPQPPAIPHLMQMLLRVRSAGQPRGSGRPSHLAMHSSRVRKRLSLPSQPPYARSTHAPSTKANTSTKALHGPGSNGKEHAGGGLNESVPDAHAATIASDEPSIARNRHGPTCVRARGMTSDRSVRGGTGDENGQGTRVASCGRGTPCTRLMSADHVLIGTPCSTFPFPRS